MKPINKFARMHADRQPTVDHAAAQMQAVIRLANELSASALTQPDMLRQTIDKTVALQNKARLLERTLLALTADIK